jgi:hypothetical protein
MRAMVIQDVEKLLAEGEDIDDTGEEHSSPGSRHTSALGAI